MMSMGLKLLYILLLAEFPLICLGTGKGEPDDDRILDLNTNCGDLGDPVRVNSDIYLTCCNLMNVFIRRNVPIIPLFDAELVLKGKHVLMKTLQNCHNIDALAREYRLRSRSDNSSIPTMFRASKRQAVIQRVQSRECHFFSLSPSLGEAYGNCGDEFGVESRGVCVGGCGPVIRHRILTNRDPICKEEIQMINCQMKSGEMKSTMIKSCACKCIASTGEDR